MGMYGRGASDRGALHLKSLACYFEGADGSLVAECGGAPQAFDTISAALPRPKFPFLFGARFFHLELGTIPVTMLRLATCPGAGKPGTSRPRFPTRQGTLPRSRRNAWAGSAPCAGRGNANYRGSENGEDCGGRNTQNVNVQRATGSVAPPQIADCGGAQGVVLRPWAFRFCPLF